MRAKVISLVLALALGGAACDSADDGNGGTGTGDRPPGEPTTQPTTDGSGPDAGRAAQPAELPQPRTEVAGAAWDGRIIVVGGLTADSRASGRADLYDPDANEWTRLADLPVPLHHTAVVEFDGRAWVVGGYTEFEGDIFVPVRRVFSLGDGEDAWREEAEMDEIRGALAAAVVDGRLMAAGGVDGTDVLDTTEVFDGRSWTPGPALRQEREHFALAESGGALFAIAGRVGGAENNLTSVEVLAGDDTSWADGLPLGHSRSGIGAASVNGRICVAGGEEPEGTIAEIECTLEDGWEVTADLATPRHGLAVVALGDSLHVIGGGPQPGLTVSGAHEVFPIPAP